MATSSAFDSFADLVQRHGQPDRIIDIPDDLPAKRAFSLTVPRQYAVWIDPDNECGCFVAGHFATDRWLINPNLNALVLCLLL